MRREDGAASTPDHEAPGLSEAALVSTVSQHLACLRDCGLVTSSGVPA